MGRLRKHKIGRPDKLTDEVEERICAAIRGGNVRSVAARWGGIDYTTFKRWMQRGKSRAKGDARYRRFAQAIKKAETDVEMLQVNRVMQAAKKDPGHAWKWLRIRRPKRWSEGPTQHEVKAKVDTNVSGKLEVKHRVPDPATVSAVLDILRRAGAAPVDQPAPVDDGGAGGRAGEGTT